MSKSTPENIKYVSGVSVYNVSPTDDIINIDTSLSSVTVVLPNIRGSGLLLFKKQFFINDCTTNAATNNITIIGAGSVVNSGANAVISTNNGSAIATIVDINEYQVSTDNPSGASFSGTPYTLAMFTGLGTTIGDSYAVQGSTDVVPIPSIVTGSGSWTVGRDNVLAGNINIAVGYDLKSYVYGDMMFGTTIHVDPTSTGNFNYWLGGDITIGGNIFQNIANLYHSSVTNSVSSILYGHNNTISISQNDALVGHTNITTNTSLTAIFGLNNTISDCIWLNIAGSGNTISLATVAGVFGYNNTISDPLALGISYCYGIGSGNIINHNNNILYGFGLTSEADYELQFGVSNVTKYIIRQDNFEWSFNTKKEYEKKSSGTTTTNDKLSIVPTTSVLQIIDIPNDSVVLIECFVTCKCTDSTAVANINEGNGYIRTVKATNNSGVVTIGTIQSSYTSETIVGAFVTFVVNLTTVELQVTGVLGNDILWSNITNLYSTN